MASRFRVPRVRIKLSCFLIGITVVGTFVGLIGRSYVIRERAAEALARTTYTSHMIILNEGPIDRLARALLRLAGYKGDSTRYGSRDRRIDRSDTDLSLLKYFPELEELIIARPGLSDDDLRELRSLVNLRSLTLCPPVNERQGRTRITDVGLTCLRGMPKLEFLGIDCPHVTDRGLGELVALRSLRGIDISSDQITVAGVGQLRSLPNLEELCVSGKQLNDEMWKIAAGMPKLKTFAWLRTWDAAEKLRAARPGISVLGDDIGNGLPY